SLSEPSSQLSFLPLSQRGFRRSQSLSNLESISKSQWNPLLGPLRKLIWESESELKPSSADAAQD
ncbi:MAG: hypothetical protein LBT98_02940, partial [Puniceicoccales bacterium]|nr:hypothetical protein [Puniceicoccales bacterium]